MAEIKRPLKSNFPISQKFGENPETYKKFNLVGHSGQDYAVPVGTPIISAQEGVVKEVDFDKDGYGNYVRIENDKFGTLYAHLSDTKVNIGYNVKQGETIGFSGNTGFSTGPHLHFAVYSIPRDYKNGYNGYVNPALYINNEQDTTMADLGTQKYSEEYVKQLEIDRKMFWEQRDANAAIITQLKTDLESLQIKFDQLFKGLAEIYDMGFENVDQIKLVIKNYKGFVGAGYTTVLDVDKFMNDTLIKLDIANQQVKERDTTIENIRICANQELTPIETVTINPQPEPPKNKWTLDKILVGLFTDFLSLFKRTKTNIETNQPIPAEDVKKAVDSWEQFSDVLRGY